MAAVGEGTGPAAETNGGLVAELPEKYVINAAIETITNPALFMLRN